MGDPGLPSYSAPRATASPYNENVDPPAYTQSKSYPVGGQNADLFVSERQLKAHLKLLGAFWELKQQVVEGRFGVSNTKLLEQKDPERRWAWFVGLAVERYVP